MVNTIGDYVMVRVNVVVSVTPPPMPEIVIV